VTTGDWADAERILAVRLDALGDVLMTTPALRALRHAHPGRHLTLLASPSGAAAAALVPDVDEVVVYEAPWMKATPPRASTRPELEMIERLRGGRYDAGVIFTVYSQNPLPAALLLTLAGIPRRLAHCRENPYQLLTEWVAEPEPDRRLRHEVQRQLDLVAAVGCVSDDVRLSLRVPPAARQRVADVLAHGGIDRSRPWAVIHPGSTAPSRRYPPEAFAAAGRGLLGRGWQLVFTGTRDETAVVEAIRTDLGGPSQSLVGRLDLGELAALLELGPVLISNNTGPVHVAAAVGAPVVDLYALTNPQHTPWGVPHRVLFHDVPCKYCYKSICPEGHHRCLRLVDPQSVVEAAGALLSETRPTCDARSLA
jgi:lipopolysaccharide heptosyltransferase II